MFCMGPFCGKFKDELQGSSDDEDEDDLLDRRKDDKIRGPRKKGRSTKRKVQKSKREEDAGGSSGYMRWSKYLIQISVKVKMKNSQETSMQSIKLHVTNKPDLPSSMMNSISQVPNLHTIELIRCELQESPPGLNDIDTLVVLRMSHNRLKTVSEDLAKVRFLERIILDWNHIVEVPPGIFSLRGFANLEVLNLSHNKLASLPPDFGMTQQPNTIKYIDLSYNEISVLPDSCTRHCKHLEVLNVSHNCLKRLPEDFELVHLHRLFVSFNDLDCLPSCIGSCKNLRKVRMISNKIRELPPSMLNLWTKRGGVLDEFLPDQNPLAMPSITTFEMSATNVEGIHEAFTLFEQHLEGEAAKEAREAIEASKTPAVEVPGAGAAAALEDAPPAADGGRELALDCNGADVGNSAEAQAPPSAGAEYYFNHCAGDKALVAQIRHAQSTLMLRKKQMYLEDQKAFARHESQQNHGRVPEKLARFLDKDLDFTHYDETIPVTDLDLYFTLLVMSTKTLYSSCYLLFDKFEIGDKGYMSRDEWNELCMCAPIQLGQSIPDRMWTLMAYKSNDRIFLTEFIAAWHVHDVEQRDPWISRIAMVLHMDFYDMEPAEFQRRLRAKDASDESPDIDFDTKEGMGCFQDKIDAGMHHGHMLDAVENPEGLRRIRYSPLEAGSSKHALNVKAQAEEEISNLPMQVSLTSATAAILDRKYHHEIGFENDDDYESLRSGDLSDDSSEEDNEFEAKAFLRQYQDFLLNEEAKHGGPLIVNSDESLKALMDVSPASFFKRSRQGVQEEESANNVVWATNGRKKHSSKREPRTPHPRMQTDVFAVRKAIRRVYRNMPHHDFVKLINFTARGLHLIKQSPRDALTYWHADDPTFKHTMGVGGVNKYTRELMKQMGFVLVNNIYWVWPEKHLHCDASQGVLTWGEKEIPHHCPGREPHRLDDMICVLRSCQRSMQTQGSKRFSGHFKTITM